MNCLLFDDLTFSLCVFKYCDIPKRELLITEIKYLYVKNVKYSYLGEKNKM